MNLFRESGGLPVEGLQLRHLGHLVGIGYTNHLLMHGNRVAKRALDLAMGSVALVLAAPIILCAAVLVRLIDGGPSFYFQARSGIDGRRITVPKVRTMRHDAEKRLDKYLAENPERQEEWKERFKLARDPWLIPLVGRLFGSRRRAPAALVGRSRGHEPRGPEAISRLSPQLVLAGLSRAPAARTTGYHRAVANHDSQRRWHRRTSGLRQPLHRNWSCGWIGRGSQ